MIDPSVPFKKRFWFGWTIFRIIARTAAALAIVVMLAGGGVFMFGAKNWLTAAVFFVMAGAIAAMACRQLLVLKRDVNLGIRRELGRRNMCVHCGYDLRASHSRCPECGKPAPASTNVEI